MYTTLHAWSDPEFSIALERLESELESHELVHVVNTTKEGVHGNLSILGYGVRTLDIRTFEDPRPKDLSQEVPIFHLRLRTTWTIGRRLNSVSIDVLNVIEAVRGMGIGSHIIRAVEKFTGECGLRVLEANVAQSYGFWERQGFFAPVSWHKVVGEVKRSDGG